MLFDDGTFSLVYGTNPTAWYNGTYQRRRSEISFSFDNRAAQWAAVGALRGDSLVIRYNDAMRASSFESALYLLSAEWSAWPGLENADQARPNSFRMLSLGPLENVFRSGTLLKMKTIGQRRLAVTMLMSVRLTMNWREQLGHAV
jgi:hypothetical protein